jgi:hypothetical protein
MASTVLLRLEPWKSKLRGPNRCSIGENQSKTLAVLAAELDIDQSIVADEPDTVVGMSTWRGLFMTQEAQSAGTLSADAHVHGWP